MKRSDYILPLSAYLMIALVLLAVSQLKAQTGVCFAVPGENSLDGPTAVHMVTADFNSDGKVDIATGANTAVHTRLGMGTGNFENPKATGFLGAVRYMTVGDFNADGKKDIAFVDFNDTKVFVMIGDGTGNFATPVGYGDVGQFPTALVTGDYNGDGKLDFATLNVGGRNISILLGVGNGTFGAAVSYPTGSSTASMRAIAQGDLNGDNKMDVVVGSSTGMYVFMGNGDGTFGAASNIGGSYNLRFLAIGDMDKDGTQDIVFSEFTNKVRIWGNNGSASFTEIGMFNNTGKLANSIQLIDLNGDGFLDIVTADTTTSGVSILLWSGSTFIDSYWFSTFSSITVVYATNLNGDNYPDLVGIVSSSPIVFLGATNYQFIKPANRVSAANGWFSTFGDFNNDSRVDMAMPTLSGGGVMVFQGDNKGGLVNKGTFPAGAYSVDATTADFNGDGNADLAVTNNNSSNVSILLGNGNFGFAGAVNYPVGANPQGIAHADFNSDGKIDLAVTSLGDNTVTVLYGVGDGTFTSSSGIAVGFFPTDIEIADFNGDGKKDIATGNQNNANISILLGDGTGDFTSITPASVPGSPSRITSSDFNEDGITDIVAITGTAVAYLQGTGNGTFSEPVTLSVANGSTTGITSADFNSDGNKDLAISLFNSASFISILLGNGTGGFAPSRDFTDYSNQPMSVNCADLDGNGLPDMAVTHGSSSDIYIYLNNSAGKITYAEGELNFCPGESVILMGPTGAGYYSYSWSTGGSTSSYTEATTSGNYSLTVTNLKGTCTSSSNVLVVKADAPATPVVTVTQPTCTVVTGDLSVTVQDAGDLYSFDNGTNFQASNAKPSVSSGSYSVKIKNIAGCMSEASQAVVNAQPVTPTTPEVTITQPTCLLATGAITITIQNAADTYSYDDGTNFQESNAKDGLASGEYKIVVKNVAGCMNKKITTINQQPAAPAKPTITLSGANTEEPVLTASAASAYQWYHDETIIENATASTLSVSEPGSYHVIVFSAEGCASVASDEQIIVVTAIEDPSAIIQVYPNPVMDVLTVSFPSEAGEKSVTIYRMNGAPVAQQQTGNDEARFDVRNYTAGVYMLTVNVKSVTKRIRFIKQ